MGITKVLTSMSLWLTQNIDRIDHTELFSILSIERDLHNSWITW